MRCLSLSPYLHALLAVAVSGACILHALSSLCVRQVPREPLLLVIRAFGGDAGWEGEGSPFTEHDEAITHQVGMSVCLGPITRVRADASRRSHGHTRPDAQPKLMRV